MTPIATFWSEPTGRAWRWLRRYADHRSTGEVQPWTCAAGWHDAKVRVDDAGVTDDQANGDLWPHEDPRWPAECEQGCGYRFAETDAWQLNAHREYRSVVDGQTFTLFDAPVGAMWDAHWLGDHDRGLDGVALAVACPQRDGTRPLTWLVDSRASNCTKPDDDAHHCWVRHGDPRTERVTVDKNGLTCDAGGGSIGIGDWHGYLRNGELVE